MSYSTTENATSARMLEERESYAVRMAAEIARLSNETAALVDACDMDAKCEHLPMVGDWSRRSDDYVPQRYQTLGEVLSEALDSTTRPDCDTALTLLARAARGEDIRADAEHMMTTLCERVGKQHAEVE